MIITGAKPKPTASLTIDDLGVIEEITHGVDGGRRKKSSVGGTNNTRAHYSNP